MKLYRNVKHHVTTCRPPKPYLWFTIFGVMILWYWQIVQSCTLKAGRHLFSWRKQNLVLYRHWVLCEINSSYSFALIILKLCRWLLHGMKMCIWFLSNLPMIFSYFFSCSVKFSLKSDGQLQIVGTLWNQPLLQFCIDHFETLQSSSTWIEDMHVIFCSNFLSFYFFFFFSLFCLFGLSQFLIRSSMFNYRQWVLCDINSSYSFALIILKVFRCILHGM